MRSEIQEVVERLRKLRRAALSHAARWLRDTPKDHHNYDFVLTQIDKLRERAEKYQRQIDAIEELHKKASKHE